MEIKIGDYIEGIEEYGPEGHENRHRMRIIVDSILTLSDGHRAYYGQADDNWKGARGGSVSDKYGPIKILSDEKPFETSWWKESKTIKETCTAWRRAWKAADIVKHFKGTTYIIIGLGIDTETEQEVVIYKKADGTGNVWVRPRTQFESEVDKEKYPDCKQKWRFELIETHH